MLEIVLGAENLGVDTGKKLVFEVDWIDFSIGHLAGEVA